MADQNSEPTWRGAAGGPPRPGKKHGWQQEDPKTATGSGKRRVKLFVIGLGATAAVVGIVWLVLLLLPSKRPGLLAIAADPGYEAGKGVGRLDVPYDPYGWQSAQRLLDWSNAVAKDANAPKPLGEKPFWLDDQLDDWADQVGKESTVDPVIIYVGLHGGVNRNGDPILYVGRDVPGPIRESNRPAVQLSTVLDKLDERAATKRKLLVLDVGRQLPDPNLGEISNDFNRAVRAKLGKRIADNPTLAVVLAANDGERAWESPDLGMTALGYHLLKSLAGGANRENMTSYRVDELFDAVQREVVQWSKNNRPTPQTPQLIPSLDEWAKDQVRKDKYEKHRLFKPADGGPPLADLLRPAPTAAPEDLKREWAAAAALANQLPHPATYTPAAWRRYRELLLRYERAVMSGDADGAGKLRDPVAGMRTAVERGLDLKLDSLNYVVPLAASTGKPNQQLAATADELLRAPTLADAATRGKAAAGGTGAPVELHLPIMLHHFVKDVLRAEKDDPLGPTWRAAATNRRLAEQAALGVRPNDAGLPYSERVWPAVRDAVRAADAARRRGEDRMLASGDAAPKDAATAFNDAEKLYLDALATAERLQTPLRLRDEAFADLPFLARWLAEADDTPKFNVDKANEAVQDLWRQAFLLADRIERPQEADPLAASVNAVRDRLTELRGYASAAAKDLATADAQTNWQAIEHLLLLPPPLVGPEDRVRLYARARDISKKLSEGNTEVAGEMKKAEEKVVRRLRSATESISGEWGRWAYPQADLSKPRTDVTAKDQDLFAKTPDLATVLLAHRRRQAEFDKYPAGGPPEWAQAELFSRVACPFAPPPAPEPATVNALARWKDMLEGQAARVALDHWYNEQGQPYFHTTVRKALLDDAEKIGGRIGDRGKARTADAAEADRLGGTPALGLKPTAAGGENGYRWTTEAERTFGYAVAPAPYPVPGEGVFTWQTDEPGLLTVSAPPRQLVDLSKPFEGGSRQLAVKAGPRIEEAAAQPRDARIQASGYFRGQRLGLTNEAVVRINRRPDLVVSEVKPDRPALLAVRADKDFDPGAVSILLDLSGSMSDEWGKTKEKKKAAMIEVLAELLKDLPRGTTLSVRAFFGNEYIRDEKSEQIFPGKFKGNFRDNLDGDDGLIRTLVGRTEKGPTPLVPTMRLALDDIKDYPGVKTLIVLTDGADTTKQEIVFGKERIAKKMDIIPANEMTAAERAAIVDAVRDDVRPFAQRGVSIHMVIFGADEAEETLGEEMFKKVEEFPTPGRVYRAKNKRALRDELENALRPKPRLVLRNGTPIPRGPDVNIPPNGLPTNRTDQGAGALYWRGFVPPGQYLLKYHTTEQGTVFRPGDGICFRMDKAANGDVKFLRELYYRDVDPVAPAGRVDATNEDWFLSAPEYGYRPAGVNYLVATAALEEKRGQEVGPNGDLRAVQPRFVWWEVARVGGNGEERFPGPVYVHNLQGQRAPCWRVVGDKGRGLDGLSDSEFRLRGWPTFGDPPAAVPQPIRATVTQLRAGLTEQVGNVVVRAKLEDIPFVPDPAVNPRLPADAANGPKRCLVVRVDDAAGRLLQVRVPQLDPRVAEHRYFYDKDDKNPLRPKVAGYTAVLGPLTDDEVARLRDLEINLVSVSDVLDPEKNRTRPLLVELRKPTNTTDDLKVLEPLR
jgi:hypothetical protein